MTRHRHDLHVPRPADEVFAVVTDPAQLPTWQPTIARVTPVTPGGVMVGARYRESRRFLGRAAEVTWTVGEHDPPRRASIAVIDGPVRGSASYTLTPTRLGTHLVVELEVEPRGVTRLLAPGLALAAETELARSIDRLERLLTAPGQLRRSASRSRERSSTSSPKQVSMA